VKYSVAIVLDSARPARSFRPAVQFVDARDLPPKTAGHMLDQRVAMTVSTYRLEQFLNAANPSCSG